MKKMLFYIFFLIAFLRDLCALCGEIYVNLWYELPEVI